jgi:hypothetical protein
MLIRASHLAVAAVVAVVFSSVPPADWPPSIELTPTPAGMDSGQPQMTSSSRGTILSWVERQGQRATLKFAERTTEGWSATRAVASGDNWFVNWADVPSVVRLSTGTLAAHWLQKSGKGTYAYDVRMSYSTDEGNSWAASFTPHSDGTQSEHGFASLFEMPAGSLGVVWLDGRTTKPGASHESHGSNHGAMSVRFGTFDRSWKQTSEMAVDLRACDCCPTSAAMTADGPIIAFRNRTEEEIRDIWISRFENGKWTGAKAVFDDGWKIAACPVNGPMLSARGRDVAIAWFTGKGDQGGAFLAFSHDAGRSFGPPIRLDDVAAMGRVDVELLADGSAIASWIEFADDRAQFRIRRVERSGAKSSPVTVAGLAGNRTSGYPRIARIGDELLFAWTESKDGRSHVQTASARLGRSIAGLF